MRGSGYVAWNERGELTLYDSKRDAEHRCGGFCLFVTWADLEAVYGVREAEQGVVEGPVKRPRRFVLLFGGNPTRCATFKPDTLRELARGHVKLELALDLFAKAHARLSLGRKRRA